MIYKVILEKEKTHWWDEDKIGIGIFNAKNDEQARAFVVTIVQSMNRKYWRIGKPRGVFIYSIHRITKNDYGNNEERIVLWNNLKPFDDFCNIRKALEAFYPKRDGRRNRSMMPLFASYKTIPFPSSL